jgi:hypothetical protein
MANSHDDVRLSQLAETYRFYGDMRFKQLTLFMAAMTAAIGGVRQFPEDRWWIGLAGLLFTAVMWIMEVRSTVNAIETHDAVRELFPRQRKFWPLLNASYAVLLLHIAFYVFWLLRIRAWCPECISFYIGTAIGLVLLVFSSVNYWRHRGFWLA